jgi:hypothetical protein
MTPGSTIGNGSTGTTTTTGTSNSPTTPQ